MSKEGQPVVYRNCSSTFSVDLSASVSKLSGHVDLLETKFIYLFIVPYSFIYYYYYFFFFLISAFLIVICIYNLYII